MVDLFTDVFHDVFTGSTPATPPTPSGVLLWDGINAPRLSMLVGLGGSVGVDPQASPRIVLNQGPGLDIGTLGDIGWTELPLDDLRTIGVDLSLEGEIDSATPNRMSFTVDNTTGNYDSTNPNGAYVVGGISQLDIGTPVWFKAVWQDVTYPIFRGTIDEATPMLVKVGEPQVRFSCLDDLEPLGRVKVGTSGPVGVGERTGARLARILDAAGHPTSSRALDQGEATCVATSFGDFALPLIQQVIDTELGTLFIDSSGLLTFWGRWHVWQATRSLNIQATFSSTDSDINLPQEPVELPKSRATVFNDALVTAGFDGAVEQQGGNGASQIALGTRTLPGSYGTLLETNAAAKDMAAWLGGVRFITAASRLSDLHVQAHTQPQWWPTLLSLRFLDRLRVLLDYGPNVVDWQTLLQGVSHDISRDHWDMTITTRPLDTVRPIMLDIGAGLDTGQLGF